jgi:hypothetical protein
MRLLVRDGRREPLRCRRRLLAHARLKLHLRVSGARDRSEAIRSNHIRSEAH